MCVFLNCSLPYFLRQSLMEPEVHSFSLTGWPVNSRELPISASPSSGLEAYTSAYVSGFYRVQGIHTQTQMLMTQVLSQMNYLPGLWFFSLSGMSFFFSYILTMTGADHVTFLLCKYIACLVLEGKTRPVPNSSRPPA